MEASMFVWRTRCLRRKDDWTLGRWIDGLEGKRKKKEEKEKKKSEITDEEEE